MAPTLLALLAIILNLHLTLATPTSPLTKRCTSVSDTNPWILSNLTAFYSSTATQSSYIFFHFTDPNTGLELDTDCSYYVNATFSSESSDGGALADGTYHVCESEEVEFAYSTAGVEVQRVYEDPCDGEPYPYDEAKAVGMIALTTVNSTTGEGLKCEQAEFEVEITEMA